MEKRIVKLSAKGQAVIPSEYRTRLGLDAGTKMRVTIIGHILQMEIAESDVQDEIAFLQEWQGDGENPGKLGEVDLDDGQITEIARDLLSQQFYGGQNLLTDRVGRHSIRVNGADTIIQETINNMVNASQDWLQGDYISTIRQYCDLFNLDFGSVLTNFNTKIRGLTMGGGDILAMMGGSVILAMIIGEILTQFRTRVGDETQEKILREAEIIGYNRKLGDETVEDKIISELADNYSILLNIKVLRELARISLKAIGQKPYLDFSEKLLSEMENMKMPKAVKKRLERRKKRRARTKGIEYVPEDDDDDDDEEESDEPEQEMTLPGMPSFDFDDTS